ncbi:trypsin-like serine protease [Corynebacterium sp. HS2168-gen11]|uniref:S1 family peptidase n=1 Tax=Corynebacterium sp. HS2168-gen11 TaxID=2974027 RepID=UPI00216B48C6|nr:trypsin-like serine protease [Corynebacterium sp. HS2168-gen11]MCS4534895.1 trypsin-like serine protease [Corynebacterium sp. HS2168-gen11]
MINSVRLGLAGENCCKAKVRMKIHTIGILVAVAGLLMLAGDISPAHAMSNATNAGRYDLAANHVVRIGSPGNTCTGVAIDEHWILTAAHCKSTQSIYDLSFGTNKSYRTYGDGFVVAPVGDIALLKSSKGLGWHCYAEVGASSPAEGTAAVAYGWGKNESNSFPQRLRTTAAHVTSKYQKAGSQMFVATYEDPAQARPGDSGAPIFVNGQVRGVLHGGLFDAEAHYTDVAQAFDWIAATINADRSPDQRVENPTGSCHNKNLIINPRAFSAYPTKQIPAWLKNPRYEQDLEKWLRLSEPERAKFETEMAGKVSPLDRMLINPRDPYPDTVTLPAPPTTSSATPTLQSQPAKPSEDTQVMLTTSKEPAPAVPSTQQTPETDHTRSSALQGWQTALIALITAIFAIGGLVLAVMRTGLTNAQWPLRG